MRVTSCLVGLALCGAVPLVAQQPRSGAGGRGEVRGVVYDSLAVAPLAGARVFVRGTDQMAVTDRGGHFRLDSVPAGTQFIGFEHDSLDAVGLSTLGQRVAVPAGRSITITLASPSHLTLRRGLCRNQLPSGSADSAVIFGSVRDIATGARLAGATVRVRWIAVQRQGPRGPIDILRPTWDVGTDSLGNYYACGVAPGLVLQVQAFADSGSTGVTEVLAGTRDIVRHDLAVSRAATVVDSMGLRRGAAALRGVIRLESGEPRPSARVSVDDTPAEALSDGEGRFLLRGLPAGSHMVMTRMVGFTAMRRVVHLAAGDTAEVELRMRALTLLDTIQVTARAAQHPLLDDLMQRMRNRVAGQVVAGEELARSTSIRSVVQRFAGIRVDGPSVSSFRLYSGTGGLSCAVRVFVDGVVSSIDVLQAFQSGELVAVEYFPRGSQAPAFASDYQCGVLLVWTRFMAS